MTIEDTLRDLLERVVDTAADAGIDLPARQFITVGGAVYDCEQVSVSGNSAIPGTAGSNDSGLPVQMCNGVWHSDVDIVIIRNSCNVSQGPRANQPPTPEAIESDAVTSSADVAMLIDFVNSLPVDYGAVPTSILLGEAQGGLAVIALSVSVNLWL